jgi:glycosyltransferase involved in cell wall biosynthesis
MKSILIILHCESNTGYAIGPLEATFFRMSLELCGGDAKRIHFAYPSMQKGPSDTLPADFRQYLVVDTRTSDPADFRRAETYIRDHGIDTVFGFDQPVSCPIFRSFRRAGVTHFVSYWGAPMSSSFGLFKRTLKRIDVALRHNGPDHYIFESMGMADLAVLGRGIPRRKTSVVYLGVDTNRFRPGKSDAGYVYAQLGIPAQRRIFFYAGHFEARKGVAVIMRAANRLAERRNQDDWQVALFGNQPGEEEPFSRMLSAAARGHVVFGGYRRDLDLIQRGCHAAVIASTGWDSFPRSGMEMQASGLPLLASALPGLSESVEHGHSGFLFAPDDDAELADRMQLLLDDAGCRDRLSVQARARIEEKFSLQAQFDGLVTTMRKVTASRP